MYYMIFRTELDAVGSKCNFTQYFIYLFIFFAGDNYNLRPIAVIALLVHYTTNLLLPPAALASTYLVVLTMIWLCVVLYVLYDF